jgi:hypothetical protein
VKTKGSVRSRKENLVQDHPQIEAQEKDSLSSIISVLISEYLWQMV